MPAKHVCANQMQGLINSAAMAQLALGEALTKLES